MRWARRVVLALLTVCAVIACKKHEKQGAEPTVPPMSAEEIKRSEDACKAYVDRACACASTVAAAATPCQLAKALPDAVQIAVETAASPESKPDIVQQAHASVRKTVKECIEQTAKLPALGCP